MCSSALEVGGRVNGVWDRTVFGLWEGMFLWQ